MKRKIVEFSAIMNPPCMVDVRREDVSKGHFRKGCPKCGWRKFSQIKDDDLKYDVGIYCSGCDTQFNFVPKKSGGVL